MFGLKSFGSLKFLLVVECVLMISHRHSNITTWDDVFEKLGIIIKDLLTY